MCLNGTSSPTREPWSHSPRGLPWVRRRHSRFQRAPNLKPRYSTVPNLTCLSARAQALYSINADQRRRQRAFTRPPTGSRCVCNTRATHERSNPNQIPWKCTGRQHTGHTATPTPTCVSQYHWICTLLTCTAHMKSRLSQPRASSCF